MEDKGCCDSDDGGLDSADCGSDGGCCSDFDFPTSLSKLAQSFLNSSSACSSRVNVFIGVEVFGGGCSALSDGGDCCGGEGVCCWSFGEEEELHNQPILENVDLSACVFVGIERVGRGGEQQRFNFETLGAVNFAIDTPNTRRDGTCRMIQRNDRN